MAKRILRRPQVIARTGQSSSSMRLAISRGDFPRQILLGARSVGWDSEAVDLWVQARVAGCSPAHMRTLVGKLNAGCSIDELRALAIGIAQASSTAEIRELFANLKALPKSGENAHLGAAS